jgi:phosphoglycerate dehydrogenase-like enzyme
MGLIFALAKNLSKHINLNRKRRWKALPSTMVKGARLGVVGLGSIGTEVAKIGKACGMEVWATKRKVAPVDFVDHLLPPDELPDLLREVDYVVLAVPLTKETYQLIGKAELDMMKSGACLINICRGAVVDEDCLYKALKKKRIRGACFDVFKNEKRLPRNNPFYKLPNMLITSWSAWYSDDADEQRMEIFFENLARFVCGKRLLSIVDSPQPFFSKQEGI